MANHKSAIKRIRQNGKRRAHNRHIKTGMRTVVRRFREAAVKGDATEATACFRDAERAVRKAASKGIIPKARASRTVGRVARKLQALTTS